ncbi:MAG: DUF1223 domain-containing protein [Pseudomonadota bacterium]
MRIALFLLLAALPAKATEPSPVLVELFTSQSCSSCPPAEANFRRLAARADVVALEWHVDYWNDISVGADGRWRDPFSSAANTERQRAYNLRLRRRATVYTPQAIINGATETVGSRGAEIDALVAKAESDPSASLAIEKRGEGFSIDAAGPNGAELLFVRFVPSATTRVGGGENAGASLAERNVVTRAETIARLGAHAAQFAVKAPPAGERCAILLEAADGGPVYAARYCP